MQSWMQRRNDDAQRHRKPIVGTGLMNGFDGGNHGGDSSYYGLSTL